MTQAQKTFSGTDSLLQSALGALVAVAALSTALVMVYMERPTFGGGAATQTQTQTQDEAVLESGRAWERQQIQQSAAGAGVVSGAVLDAAREWERQQIQQSPGGLGRGGEAHSPTAPTPR